MTENTDLAWAAGFIDGEGTFNARAMRPSTRSNAHRQLFVTVSNTDKRPLERLQRLFGGALRGPYIRGSYKPVWTWQLASRSAVTNLIAILLPHMSVKREQAEAALRSYAALDSILKHRRVASIVTATCQLSGCGRAFTHPDYQRARKFCSHSCAARSKAVA